MANILGIFTAIILAVAAFVASKNKTRLADEIVAQETAAQSLKTSQARLIASQEKLKKLPLERSELDGKAAKKTEEETAIKQATAEMEELIDTKNKKFAANKEELDSIRTKIDKAGDMGDLLDKMKTVGADLEELDQSITSREATLANLTAQNTSVQTEATRRKDEFASLQKGDSLASLNTRIRSVYSEWGFVTLADGNDGGVIGNSVLNVVRGDEIVARLLVTAVESGSATASIIPESLGENVVLVPGDRVVPGSKDEKDQASN